MNKYLKLAKEAEASHRKASSTATEIGRGASHPTIIRETPSQGTPTSGPLLEVDEVIPPWRTAGSEKSEDWEVASTGPDGLKLRILAFFQTVPANRSATASEIAEALFCRDYTLGNVLDCCHCCEALEESNILIPGTDGYGYQIQRG